MRTKNGRQTEMNNAVANEKYPGRDQQQSNWDRKADVWAEDSMVENAAAEQKEKGKRYKHSQGTTGTLNEPTSA